MWNSERQGGSSKYRPYGDVQDVNSVIEEIKTCLTKPQEMSAQTQKAIQRNTRGPNPLYRPDVVPERTMQFIKEFKNDVARQREMKINLARKIREYKEFQEKDRIETDIKNLKLKKEALLKEGAEVREQNAKIEALYEKLNAFYKAKK
jgi:hypothetical protein